MKKHFRVLAGVIGFFFLVCLFLPGCTPRRILTDFWEEEYITYIALQDGYLHFTEDEHIYGSYVDLLEISARYAETPEYSDIVADLGVDPVEMSKILPEKFHLTPETLQPVTISGSEGEGEYPFGGYSFMLEGEPEKSKEANIYATPQFIITLKRMTGMEGESYPKHNRWTVFNVLPWELTRSGEYENRNSDYEIYHSEINGQEVGVTHGIDRIYSFFPGREWHYFYGGFFAGDLAVCIESEFGYCTQEEFVKVFLAIFDYVTALKS